MIAEAINRLSPTTEFTMDGDEYNGVKHLRGPAVPSEKEVNAEIVRIKEEIEASNKKKIRDDLVSKIVVTVSTGKVFDGDEKSQSRLVRAVAVGEPNDKTMWKLADNTLQEVTYEELKEAALLAGQAQTLLWAKYV